MDKQRLEEIRQRCEKATALERAYDKYDTGISYFEWESINTVLTEDVPYLLSEIDRLEAESKELKDKSRRLKEGADYWNRRLSETHFANNPKTNFDEWKAKLTAEYFAKSPKEIMLSCSKCPASHEGTINCNVYGDNCLSAFIAWANTEIKEGA
jgi:hypothetical protein